MALHEVTEEELNITEAAAAMAMGLDIDLEETAPLPVAVTFNEWVEEPVLDEHGKTQRRPDGSPIVHMHRVSRRALIETFVPMDLFLKMMASREAFTKTKSVDPAGKAASQEATLAWVGKQVLNVWQLTEPDMTEERLRRGLNFKQVYGLFTRFFGDLLQQQNTQK